MDGSHRGLEAEEVVTFNEAEKSPGKNTESNV